MAHRQPSTDVSDNEDGGGFSFAEHVKPDQSTFRKHGYGKVEARTWRKDDTDRTTGRQTSPRNSPSVERRMQSRRQARAPAPEAAEEKASPPQRPASKHDEYTRLRPGDEVPGSASSAESDDDRPMYAQPGLRSQAAGISPHGSVGGRGLGRPGSNAFTNSRDGFVHPSSSQISSSSQRLRPRLSDDTRGSMELSVQERELLATQHSLDVSPSPEAAEDADDAGHGPQGGLGSMGFPRSTLALRALLQPRPSDEGVDGMPNDSGAAHKTNSAVSHRAVLGSRRGSPTQSELPSTSPQPEANPSKQLNDPSSPDAGVGNKPAQTGPDPDSRSDSPDLIAPIRPPQPSHQQKPQSNTAQPASTASQPAERPATSGHPRPLPTAQFQPQTQKTAQLPVPTGEGPRILSTTATEPPSSDASTGGSSFDRLRQRQNRRGPNGPKASKLSRHGSVGDTDLKGISYVPQTTSGHQGSGLPAGYAGLAFVPSPGQGTPKAASPRKRADKSPNRTSTSRGRRRPAPKEEAELSEAELLRRQLQELKERTALQDSMIASLQKEVTVLRDHKGNAIHPEEQTRTPRGRQAARSKAHKDSPRTSRSRSKSSKVKRGTAPGAAAKVSHTPAPGPHTALPADSMGAAKDDGAVRLEHTPVRATVRRIGDTKRSPRQPSDPISSSPDAHMPASQRSDTAPPASGNVVVATGPQPDSKPPRRRMDVSATATANSPKAGKTPNHPNSQADDDIPDVDTVLDTPLASNSGGPSQPAEEEPAATPDNRNMPRTAAQRLAFDEGGDEPQIVEYESPGVKPGIQRRRGRAPKAADDRADRPKTRSVSFKAKKGRSTGRGGAKDTGNDSDSSELDLDATVKQRTGRARAGRPAKSAATGGSHRANRSASANGPRGGGMSVHSSAGSRRSTSVDSRVRPPAFGSPTAPRLKEVPLHARTRAFLRRGEGGGAGGRVLQESSYIPVPSPAKVHRRRSASPKRSKAASAKKPGSARRTQSVERAKGDKGVGSRYAEPRYQYSPHQKAQVKEFKIAKNAESKQQKRQLKKNLKGQVARVAVHSTDGPVPELDAIRAQRSDLGRLEKELLGKHAPQDTEELTEEELVERKRMIDAAQRKSKQRVSHHREMMRRFAALDAGTSSPRPSRPQSMYLARLRQQGKFGRAVEAQNERELAKAMWRKEMAARVHANRLKSSGVLHQGHQPRMTLQDSMRLSDSDSDDTVSGTDALDFEAARKRAVQVYVRAAEQSGGGDSQLGIRDVDSLYAGPNRPDSEQQMDTPPEADKPRRSPPAQQLAREMETNWNSLQAQGDSGTGDDSDDSWDEGFSGSGARSHSPAPAWLEDDHGLMQPPPGIPGPKAFRSGDASPHAAYEQRLRYPEAERPTAVALASYSPDKHAQSPYGHNVDISADERDGDSEDGMDADMDTPERPGPGAGHVDMEPIDTSPVLKHPPPSSPLAKRSPRVVPLTTTAGWGAEASPSHDREDGARTPEEVELELGVAPVHITSSAASNESDLDDTASESGGEGGRVGNHPTATRLNFGDDNDLTVETSATHDASQPDPANTVSTTTPARRYINEDPEDRPQGAAPPGTPVSQRSTPRASNVSTLQRVNSRRRGSHPFATSADMAAAWLEQTQEVAQSSTSVGASPSGSPRSNGIDSDGDVDEAVDVDLGTAVDADAYGSGDADVTEASVPRAPPNSPVQAPAAGEGTGVDGDALSLALEAAGGVQDVEDCTPPADDEVGNAGTGATEAAAAPASTERGEGGEAEAEAAAEAPKAESIESLIAERDALQADVDVQLSVHCAGVLSTSEEITVEDLDDMSETSRVTASQYTIAAALYLLLWGYAAGRDKVVSIPGGWGTLRRLLFADQNHLIDLILDFDPSALSFDTYTKIWELLSSPDCDTPTIARQNPTFASVSAFVHAAARACGRCLQLGVAENPMTKTQRLAEVNALLNAHMRALSPSQLTDTEADEKAVANP